MGYLLVRESLKAHMRLKSLGNSQYTGLAGGGEVRRRAALLEGVRIITV